VFRRVPTFVLSAQVVVLAELALVLFLEQGRLASVWESHMGAILLAPTLLLAAAAVGAFAAMYDAVLFGRGAVDRVILGILTGALGLSVGY